VRIVAGVVSLAAGGLWLLCAISVLRSRFATDPAVDPHGYMLIFGTFLAVPAGLVCALALSFAVVDRARARVVRIAMPSFVIASVLLVVALLTE
jgi:uncharacterized membrane protein SpoIIM required for sporulation